MKYLNPQRYLFLWMAALMLLAQGCAVTPADVYKVADTDGKKALATIELARIYTEMAVSVSLDPTTAPEAVAAFKAVNARLRPTIDALFEAYVDYKKAYDAWVAGDGSLSGQVMILAANLRGWVGAAQSHIDAMRSLVAKWKGAEVERLDQAERAIYARLNRVEVLGG